MKTLKNERKKKKKKKTQKLVDFEKLLNAHVQSSSTSELWVSLLKVL